MSIKDTHCSLRFYSAKRANDLPGRLENTLQQASPQSVFPTLGAECVSEFITFAFQKGNTKYVQYVCKTQAGSGIRRQIHKYFYS